MLRILPTVRLVTGDQVQARVAAFLEANGESTEAPDPGVDGVSEEGQDQGDETP